MLPALIKAYPAVLGTIIALDLLWVGLLMKDFYRVKLGHLMSGEIVWGAVVVFYLIYAAGLTYFAVLPAISKGSAALAVLLGMGIGLIAYGTYDLTNHGTLKDWPAIVTIIDILWGMCLSGVGALAGALAVKLLS